MKGKPITKRSVATNQNGDEIYTYEEKLNRYGDTVMTRMYTTDTRNHKVILETSTKNSYGQDKLFRSSEKTRIIDKDTDITEDLSDVTITFDVNTSKPLTKTRTVYGGNGNECKTTKKYFAWTGILKFAKYIAYDGHITEYSHFDTKELENGIVEHRYAKNSKKHEIVRILQCDKNNNVVCDIDYMSNQTIYRTYDDTNKLLSEHIYLTSIPGQDDLDLPKFMLSKTAYEYNEKGQLVEKSIDTTSSLSTYKYTYDKNGNVMSESHVTLPVNNSIPSVDDYDLDKTLIEYEYDDKNRVIYQKTTYELIKDNNVATRVTETRTTYSA